ncbi:hypothetical protein BMA10247_A1804 [Burkholderia mallei NCTC 10247]|nr:hypothetical protein BMA10247_A1804 [Burkholderia mallei NCTC 10247]EEP88517.1 conserved hypothetical protein [Burkholderia mallei GB8 horse 4]
MNFCELFRVSPHGARRAAVIQDPSTMRPRSVRGRRTG